MLFLVKATIPNASGNTLVKRGPEMKVVIDKIMGDVRPQAAYFGLANGQRTLFLIVDVAEAHELPRVAEPLWLALNADVEATPIMSVDQFDKAGPILGSIVPKY